MQGTGKLPTNGFADRGSAERPTFALSHFRTDACNLALPQGRERVATVLDTAVLATGGAPLFDVILAALLYLRAHLLPNAAQGKVGDLAVVQLSVQPGRPI